MRKMRLAALVLCGLAPWAAQGHFALLDPPSALRVEDGGKGAPPCAEGQPSNIVTDARGGHAITVRLREFVFHPGHYRFALSVKSRAELPPDPDVVTDANGDSVSASIQNPARIPVLADGVFPHTTPPTGDWQTSITLPNLDCERCTLQIIQFMAEHGPNFGGGFYYHHCADLHITADPSLPPADRAWPGADTQPNAAFPYVAAGGGWSTALNLVNTSAKPVPVTLGFRADDGGALNLTPAPPVSLTLGPNQTTLVSVGEQAPAITKGWAEVRSAVPIGGFAIVRPPPGGSSSGEAVMPLQTQFLGAATLPFDNTDGFSTNLVIANASAAPANIIVAAWDDGGIDLGSVEIAVPAGGRLEVAAASQMPRTARKRGIARLQSTTGAIACAALRFSASSGVIALPPL